MCSEQHSSARQRGLAWHSTARCSIAQHGMLPGMPSVHRDKLHIRAFLWDQAAPEPPQPGRRCPAPAPRSDSEAPASQVQAAGMNSQSKTRQPESNTPPKSSITPRQPSRRGGEVRDMLCRGV